LGEERVSGGKEILQSEARKGGEKEKRITSLPARKKEKRANHEKTPPLYQVVKGGGEKMTSSLILREKGERGEQSEKRRHPTRIDFRPHREGARLLSCGRMREKEKSR